MNIYWGLVGATLILGRLLPQEGKDRKIYIWIMAVVHAFVSGCRYMYLTGDLLKYASDYFKMSDFSWFSPEVFHDGRNAGFFWLMKLCAQLSGENFQVFLAFLAVVIEIIVAIMIYRYSPKPWFSYFLWNCMGFYVAGFSLIKQALAMAIVMCAMMCVFERKPIAFYLCIGIAGAIHTPALVFLPVYMLSQRQIDRYSIVGYIGVAALIYVLRNYIVDYAGDFYYEEETFQLASPNLGGRFFVIVLILLCAVLLQGFREKNYESLFHVITLAAIVQMFSGYDNVFSRLADYFLQFTILFIPMIFYEMPIPTRINRQAAQAPFPFNRRSIRLIVSLLVVVFIWWYWRTCIGVTIAYAVDDYTNFRFMWDVVAK